MSNGDETRDPVEAILDLLLYAPLGLVTQLDDLLPGLIEKGRSQAVLAKTIGEFALRAGTQKAQGCAGDTQRSLEEAAQSLIGMLSNLLDRSVASTDGGTSEQPAPPASENPEHPPIADYDSLKATEIIPLLDALSDSQRSAIEAQERAGRSRKTILNRLAQLSTP
jgi:hypothetical protein